MSMDATVQVRMDSKLKNEVEELYRNLGTSFSEAVRVFAQQSVREGGMPFRPRLLTLDEMDDKALEEKLSVSLKEAAMGDVLDQEEVDAFIAEKFNNDVRRVSV